MTAEVFSVVNNFDRGVRPIYSTKRRRLSIAQAHATKRHASVNLVYGKKPPRYVEDNRTEVNCPHW